MVPLSVLACTTPDVEPRAPSPRGEEPSVPSASTGTGGAEAPAQIVWILAQYGVHASVGFEEDSGGALPLDLPPTADECAFVAGRPQTTSGDATDAGTVMLSVGPHEYDVTGGDVADPWRWSAGDALGVSATGGAAMTAFDLPDLVTVPAAPLTAMVTEDDGAVTLTWDPDPTGAATMAITGWSPTRGALACRAVDDGELLIAPEDVAGIEAWSVTRSVIVSGEGPPRWSVNAVVAETLYPR